MITFAFMSLKEKKMLLQSKEGISSTPESILYFFESSDSQYWVFWF